MQTVRRNHHARIVRLLLLAFGVAYCLTAGRALAVPMKPANLKVTLDPGHGGAYSGAVYGGVAEKDVNLAIAKRVASELRARGVQVQLTRNGDSKVYQGGGIATWRWSDPLASYEHRVFPAQDGGDRLAQDLQARVDAANAHGSDLFVSIHNNAGGSSAVGSEVWRAPNDPLGELFATDVLNRTTAAAGSHGRGVHSANFYVIRWSNTPAVLVECGFLSNAGERDRLRSASYQAALARGIANGILQFASRSVDENITRLWGPDRYATAASVAVRGWPEGADTVVLVSGEVFADSLVAAPLATQLGAPLLTTRSGSLPPAIAEQIARLEPRRIIVVGGTSAMDEKVAAQAADAAGAPTVVERVAGADRYQTSLRVAEKMSVPATGSAIVASGVSFPDALSVAASASERGEPILLAPRTGFSAEARSFIGTRTVTVVGGPAVVPESVVAGMSAQRLWGADRYATNWAVLEARYDETQTLSPAIASATSFPDALVLGPLAAKEHRPVLLIGKTTVAGELRPRVYEHRDDTFSPIIIGGPAVVSAYVDPMFTKWKMRSF